MKHVKYHIFLIASMVLFFSLFEAQISYAQLSTPTTSQLQIERLIDPEGLLSNNVRPIIQDHQGFMWFGTLGDGLIRYDGYEYIHYSHDPTDSTTLSSNLVQALLVDSSGDLWIGTDNGLNRFDTETERFTRFNLNPDDSTRGGDNIWDILEDQMDDLWIGTLGGLIRYDSNSGSFTRYTHDPEDPTSLGCYRVWELYEDRQGTLWIGTVGNEENSLLAPCQGGLNRFDRETESFQRFFYDSTPLDNGIYSLLEDSNGSFWVGAFNGWMITSDGLYLFDRETGEFDRGSFNLSELSNSTQTSGESSDNCSNFECLAIYSMYEDNSGGIWLSNLYNGVYRYDPNSGDISIFNSANSGFGDNMILSVVESKDGTLWFGTSTGVYKVNSISNFFSELTGNGASESLNGSTITSLLEDQNDQIWIGTDRSGLYQLDIKSGALINSENLKESGYNFKNTFIASLYEESSGVIWIGHGSFNDNTVIHTYYPETKQFTPLATNFIDRPPLRVIDFVKDNSGRYWLGSIGFAGLYLLEPSENKAIFYRPNFRDTTNLFEENIYKLLTDRDGSVWVGSVSGLYKLIEGQEMSTRKFLPNRQVVDLFEDSEGRFWVGTWGDGLHLLDRDTGSSIKYGRKEGLSSDKVASILEDDQGFIWISTAEGDNEVSIDGELSHLNPEDGSITIFSRQNGLPEVGFYSGSKLKTRDGKLFFGGNGGVVYFDPEEITEPSQTPPTMVLTGLLIQNEKVSPGEGSVLKTTVSQADEIQLLHNQNDITLTYAGLSFRDPERTQYEYIMDGFDEEWIEAGAQRSIRYSGLPAGSYTFRSRGLNSQGVWSTEDATLEITVLPPWWRTWWAYALYALLFAAGVFAVDRFQRKRLIKRERERARERELEQQKAHASDIQQAYKNLETAHENLKSAQEQLIQQEKLASLGQLTAGIAHEIKNPLNFVNNFSDVSIEMVDEAKDELTRIKALKSSAADKIAEEIAIILTDVEANLRKIHEHGSRADRIVKSMLQHSRGGEGERQPTDLNALIEEYVHLSYHGMRAGQKPIDCEIELDLDDSLEEIIINPEEMSRVIVNICNNAFDAMWQKANVNRDRGNEYSPILEVRTILEQSNVKIEVKDNGLGVPEKIRGNILQPFFTTKKGTEGTGLGLSISSNIIKAHGGEIHIESVEGKYTLFQIILPNVTSEV